MSLDKNTVRQENHTKLYHIKKSRINNTNKTNKNNKSELTQALFCFRLQSFTLRLDWA